ncbi:MAG: nuclear transport factor 2 family protein [Steroidobacteraceae bacterium]
MQIWELLIREQVSETIARYANAGDGGRLEELTEQFTARGILEMPPNQRAAGRQDIQAMLKSGTQQKPPVAFAGQKAIIRHYTATTQFRLVTEARVEAITYFQAWTAVGPDHWGRYFDTLVPVGDRWLFEHRVAKVEGYASGGWYDVNRPRPGS